MSVQAMREFVNRHSVSLAGLAALAAALEAKANEKPLPAGLAARVDDLLGAMGATERYADLTPAEAKVFLAEIRVGWANEGRLLYEKSRCPGWTHTDPDVLQAAGDTSVGFVQPLAKNVVPNLEGLADRLAAPGAAFVDVGSGVAAFTIAMARQWPNMKAVAVDPWQPSLALARQNVKAAGLEDRIELREQRGEDMTDDQAFDLAWISNFFMPTKSVRPACERIHRALRPGGWIIFFAINPGFDGEVAAMWRLRLALFGDSALPAADAEALLRDSGFRDVRTLPNAGGTFLGLVVARK